MKRYLSGLIGFALVAGSLALAQAPAPMPAGPTGAPVVMLPADGGACCPGKTTCVPEKYMKKTTTVVYSSGCEPLCLCYFHGLFKKCDCESGHCERPYTRKYLVKKVHTSEECATKCVPSQGAACEYGHCAAPMGCAGTTAPVMAPPSAVVPVQPAR